jgi:hypothetical protein
MDKPDLDTGLSLGKNFSGAGDYMDILEGRQLMNTVKIEEELNKPMLNNDREFLRRCNVFISSNDFFKKEDIGNDILREIFALNQEISDSDGKLDEKSEEKLTVLYNNIALLEDEVKDKIFENFSDDYHTDLRKIMGDLLDDKFENMNINSRILINYINNGIKVALCRMKNRQNSDKGAIIKKIPAEWKLTKDKKDIYEKYIQDEEFSPYTFRKPRKINKEKMKLFGDNSLYKYMTISENYPELSKVYAKLYSEISGYIRGLNELVGYSYDDKSSAFSSNYSYYIVKHVFLLIILKLSEIIQTDDPNIMGIIEESEDIYPLFHINVETDSETPTNTIISKLIFDLLFNIYLENNESENISLYYNDDLLSEKITKEREREKISVVDKLTTMDHEKRGIEIQMQEFGMKNIYKGKEAENLEWIHSDAYQDFRMAERERLYGDATLLDPEASSDFREQVEMEEEAHVERMEGTDNMDYVNPDLGYDNGDFADDELED